MRLIHTKTLEIHSFSNEDTPPYTILSHTWEKNNELEVLYDEMPRTTPQTQESTTEETNPLPTERKERENATPKPTPETKRKPGYTKIVNCAKKSREMKRPDGLVGYDYTWVDTCCIDKKSEVELSESLNSMYAWYRNSAVCIAHIEDFHGDDIDQATATNRWFTRGWTLQELIASKDVIFYSGDWEEIGDKKKNARRLEEITSIDRQVLLVLRDLENVSVAEKMKWISYRTTKKIEDMSYCMFGIFDINLPTIYGEGSNAFRRLQEEIIRTLDDVTIFLWKEEGEGDPNPFAHRGALARNPKEFRGSRAPRTPLCVLPDPFTSTNKGIMMTTELYALKESFCAENDGLNKAHIRAEFQRGAIFALRFHEDKPSQHLNTSNTILLKRLLSTTGQYQYCRVYPGYLFHTGFSHWSNNPKQLVTISGRLPLSNFAAKLVCERFEVMLGGEKLTKQIEDSHSDTNPHGLKAVFRSKDFPSLQQEIEGCLMLIFHDIDNSIRASFFDATALERAREKEAGDEDAFSELAKLAKSRKTKGLFIGDVSFRLNQETNYGCRVRGRQIHFVFSRRHTTEGVLLQVGISVAENFRS